ncbi:hypothetical protein HK097_001683, partial [Rhizophlyctis rosea]
MSGSPPPPNSFHIPKLLYFTLFLAFCSSPALLPILYRQAGLSTQEIGILSSISPWISMIAAPCWTYLADKKNKPLSVLVGTVIGTAAVQWGLVWASEGWGFWALVGMVMVGAIVGAPTGAVLDGIVLRVLGDRKNLYGRQRLWGAISCGLSTFLAGAAVSETGTMYSAFLLHSTFTIIFLIVLAFCWRPLKSSISPPSSAPPSKLITSKSQPLLEKQKSASLTSSEKTLQPHRHHNHTSRISQFMETYEWLFRKEVGAFFLSMAAMGASFAVVGSFLFIYMIEDLGATPLLRGLSGPFDVALELPFFFYGNEVLAKVGIRKSIILAHIAQIIRLLCYTLIPAGEGAWSVLAVELLHGFAFTILWTSAQSYLSQIAPQHQDITAQGILSAIYSGLGSGLGGIGGGMIHKRKGALAAFRVMAGMLMGSLVVFVAVGPRSGG